MDLELVGKKAFVSGSTQGIGRAIAATLLTEGASVVVNGRDLNRVEQTVTELASAGSDGEVSGVAADLTDPAEVERLVAAAGEVDILINNAGRFGLASFADTADDEWWKYLDVNVMSGVRLARSFLPGMLGRGWGRIVFVSSESGLDVPAEMVPYGVSKAAQLALGNGLAKLTRGSGVTVNSVVGGPTYSDGVADTVIGIAEAQQVEVDELKSQLIGARPTSLLQRFIEPTEIADLVAYLASPRSSATNGAALRADGGVLTTS